MENHVITGLSLFDHNFVDTGCPKNEPNLELNFETVDISLCPNSLDLYNGEKNGVPEAA